MLYVSVSTATSHAVETHENITYAATRFLSTISGAVSCSRDLNSLLQIGTTLEDKFPRPVFHFNPALRSSSCSSEQWGLEDIQCRYFEYFPVINIRNIHTYPRSEFFAKSEDYEQSIRELGYVLHLIQDLTSPAHVRGDAHLNVGVKVDGRLYPIPHMTDVDPLEKITRSPVLPSATVGLIPISSPEQFFRDLADFTRSSFYSKDTVGLGVGPSPASEDADYFYDNRGRKIAFKGQKFKDKQANGGVPTLRDATVDEIIADEQFAELGPVAVRASASFIDYFVRTNRVRLERCLNPGQKISYLPAHFAGLRANNPVCLGRDKPGELSITRYGSVVGSGCLDGVRYPGGQSWYSFKQGSLSVFQGSLRNYVSFVQSAADVNQANITLRNSATSVHFINEATGWRTPHPSELRVNPINRLKQGLAFIANRPCTAMVRGIAVAADAHIEFDAARLYIKRGPQLISSATFTDLLIETPAFNEYLGPGIGTVGDRVFSMGTSRTPSLARGLTSVQIALDDVKVNDRFRFSASEMKLPNGEYVSAACNAGQ